MSLFKGMLIKSSDQKRKGKNSTNKNNETKEEKLLSSNAFSHENNLINIKNICNNLYEEKDGNFLNYGENKKCEEKSNREYEYKKNISNYDFEILSSCTTYENINNKIDGTYIHKSVSSNEKMVHNNAITHTYDNLSKIELNNFNCIKIDNNDCNYFEKKCYENMSSTINEESENNYSMLLRNNCSSVDNKRTMNEYTLLNKKNMQQKEYLYEDEDELNYISIIQNIFSDIKNTNFISMQNIFRKLHKEYVNKNTLIILYFFIYHSFIYKKMYNLKAEYKCDKLIYKLLLSILKIRKKRKRDKEKEKILIINEKLDSANIVQNKIFNYNFMLIKIEDYITQLFKKKKNIYHNNFLLKNYVCNFFKIIIYNIYLNKKKENKNQKSYFEEKKKELDYQELKILEKEKKLNNEESSILKEKEKIENENKNINKCIQDISIKYDEQLNEINDKINTIDDDIKELEKQIELRKIEKMNTLKVRDHIEDDKNKELNLLFVQKSEINTNFNFINSSIDRINEKRKQINEEKEKTKNMEDHLKMIYENFHKKKELTDTLIMNLQKIMHNFYKDNNIEEDNNSFINIISVGETNPLLNEMNIKTVKEENSIEHENEFNILNKKEKEIKKEIKIEKLSNDISDADQVSKENNILTSRIIEESDNIKEKYIMKNNENKNKNDIRELTNKSCTSNYNLDLSNSLKKIFLLKKSIFKIEKEINCIKEKKKKLMIDINQYNCEIDNINIKKENLKNKKKILLKSKMLNEIKNTINELNELVDTEGIIFNQLEIFKADMNNLKKKYIFLKKKKEKIKENLFILEKRLLKREIINVEYSLKEINNKNSQNIQSNDLTKKYYKNKTDREGMEEFNAEKMENEKIKENEKQEDVKEENGKQEDIKEESEKQEDIKEDEKKEDIKENEKGKEEIKNEEDFVFSEDSEESILKISFSKIIDELKDINSVKEYDESNNDNKSDLSENSFLSNSKYTDKKKKKFINLDKIEKDQDEYFEHKNNENEKNKNENSINGNKEDNKNEVAYSEVEVENSEIEIENIDDENENSEIEIENIDDENENSEIEIENSEDENENSEIEIENSEDEMENSKHKNKKTETNESEISSLINSNERKNLLSSGNSNRTIEISENKDIIKNEESNINNNDFLSDNYYNELFDTLKRLNKEESEKFEQILDKYKTIYVSKENINHNILEQEIQGFYNNIVKEENIFKTKKLTILNKKKRALKKYYYYVSDNSEDDELNI